MKDASFEKGAVL